jgi:hypothetical protein
MKTDHLTLAIAGFIIGLTGFAIGRAYPSHNYRPFASGAYVYDTHTGQACYPFRAAQDRANAANGVDPPNIIDRGLRNKTAAEMTPACGSE